MIRTRRCRTLCAVGLHRDEEGSTLLLTLAYVVLALAVVLVCANASSLYLAQKRLDALADSAALAGADGFRVEVIDGEPRASLVDGAVERQAEAIVDAVGGGARMESASTPDGVSARVMVADEWHPLLLSAFVPDGVRLESTATSRTALN